MGIAIVTDSSSGLTNKNDIKDLFVVPLMITKDDGTEIKDDEKLSTDSFYKLLDASYLKTSQSSPKDMLEMWDKLLEEYDEIVVALLSDGLSGQFNTMNLFSKDDKYNGKVFVIETKGVSVILERELQIIRKLIDQGKSAQEISELFSEKYSKSFVTYIIPKSLDRLVKGGRISKAAASLAKLFKINPILKYDGSIDKEEKVRTFKKAISRSVDLLISKIPGLKTIDISYSKTDDETLNSVIEIIKESGLEIGLQSELPNVIVTHTGRDAFSLNGWFIED